MRQQWLYLFRSAPFTSAVGQEGLDALLIGASFEQTISVVFVYEGVHQVTKGHACDNELIRLYTKTFKALEDFDVQNRYVHQASLQALGVERSDVFLDAQFIDSEQLSKLIAQQDRVLVF